MSKRNFKVGDKIKYRHCEKDYTGLVVEADHGRILVRLKGFAGHDGAIASKHGPYKTKDHWWVNGRDLELLEKETIVIYRNGQEVIALDKTTGEKAVAKCSPYDEFDFNTGAKLAFERLLDCQKEVFKPYLEECVFKSHYGLIGESTPLKDAIGREISVGDTVDLYNEGNDYYGEKIVVKHYGKAFIRGIESSCFENGSITGGWKIILNRKYEDIKHGEIVDGIQYVKKQ